MTTTTQAETVQQYAARVAAQAPPLDALTLTRLAVLLKGGGDK